MSDACHACEGTGQVCSGCFGRGERTCVMPGGNGFVGQCGRCKGTGRPTKGWFKVHTQDCGKCKGTGRQRPGDREACGGCKGTGRDKASVHAEYDGPIPDFVEGVPPRPHTDEGGNPNWPPRPGEVVLDLELPSGTANPKTAAGSRKAPLQFVPPAGMILEARVFALGAKKYSPYNWRESTVPASIYYEALLRHIFAWWDGEEYDEESGMSHLGHARACAAIILDAQAHGTLEDDRPPKGPAPALLASLIQGSDDET